MMKLINKFISTMMIIIFVILLFLNTKAHAVSETPLSANLKTYKLGTDKTFIDSGYDYSRNSNTLTYITPNQSYDFFDENGIYNSVYITKNGVLKVDTSKGIDSSEDLSDLIDIVSIGE